MFACSAAGGEEVVVKLTATLEEARLEAAALASWAHTGAAVRLINADVRYGALLLERREPGRQAERPGHAVGASRGRAQDR